MRLTDHQRKTLEMLAGGMTLKSRRIYPFPHTFGLYTPEAPGIPVKDIGEATVRGLVSKGLVQPCPTEKMFWDTVLYEITPLGHKAVA